MKLSLAAATFAFGFVLPCAALFRVARAQETPAAAPPVAAPIDPKLEAEKTASVKAIQNVKALSTACVMNAADNNYKFKIKSDTFKTDVGAYALDKAVFTSPLDKPGTASYKFNKELNNLSYGRIRKPSQTVMVYEGEWGKPAFRYHGMAVLGFADGHVKLFRPETAKRLSWKP